MKTPDEIKKGLECCLPFDEERCCDCPYCHGEEACFVQKNNDILSLIQQQEQQLAEKDARIAELERERDAAVDEIFQTCSNCKYEKQGYGVWPCPPVEEYVKTTDCSNWQWRGVQEVG